MTSVTYSDDVSPVSWQPPESSRDSTDVSYDAVLGLLLCSCALVVAALTVYFCSVARYYRHVGRHRAQVPSDDVIDHVTTPTAVTSLSSSARSKEVEDVSVNTGLLKPMDGTGSISGQGEAVTWYGSRDVEVGRPTNVRYVSLRHCARQSSSVESESDNRKVTPLVPKRFGFVGWSRPAVAPPSGDSLRHQSSSDAAVTSVADDSSKTPTADCSNDRYVITIQTSAPPGTLHPRHILPPPGCDY